MIKRQVDERHPMSKVTTHFSVRVSGPWSVAGPGDRGSLPALIWPKLRLSPFILEAILLSSWLHTPTELLLLGGALLSENVGDRQFGDAWSLGKYEMDDCRLELPERKVQAVGGGVDRPSDDKARGDNKVVGDSNASGTLLSRSWRGRGPKDVGERGDTGTAVTVLVLLLMTYKL